MTNEVIQMALDAYESIETDEPLVIITIECLKEVLVLRDRFVKGYKNGRPDATRWIPIKTRPLTEEEKEEYEDESEWYEFMYDCELPEHGQEVLIQLHYGIAMTTFYTDMGCYFENYEDEDDVIAWMPLPEPYREEQNK